eukprot:CAMPEP_0170188678 /NCGR_PEP_ID=MMETSP0040_2-20121228/44958_1 /TAXON_ID=641309 /ORGANISM="Lotharella oceanica, Strain CCMP622" /LENGTH=102 /DNA_ID=CAMNT_0010436029 /DNA_START=484 /DNA_END=789 /DNA_ORIENTATION=+
MMIIMMTMMMMVMMMMPSCDVLVVEENVLKQLWIDVSCRPAYHTHGPQNIRDVTRRELGTCHVQVVLDAREEGRMHAWYAITLGRFPEQLKVSNCMHHSSID